MELIFKQAVKRVPSLFLIYTVFIRLSANFDCKSRLNTGYLSL